MPTRPPLPARSRNGPDGVRLNLLASALTILTAVALLGAANVLGDSSVAVVESARHDHVVHDFYRAVNATFRSGDASALEGMVAPNLAFHPPFPGLASSRAGLERYLASVHATYPAFQLLVQDMVSDGDRTIVRVAGGSEKPGSFLGLTLAAAPSAWGQFDSFRIADGQIVEMWSGAPAPALFEQATAVPLDLEISPQAISLERLTASNGERQDWGPFTGTRVLYVDEGSITVDVSPTESTAVPSTERNGHGQQIPVVPGAPVVVTAGQVMSFSTGSRYRFRHDATDAGVVALTIALPSFHYVGPYQAQESTETDEDRTGQVDLSVVQMVVGGEQVLDPVASVTVSLGRLLLPAGANVAFHETDGYLFVVVETGALFLTRDHSVMSLDRLNTGSGGLIQPGESFALHSLDDAATVFMVTVLPRTILATPTS